MYGLCAFVQGCNLCNPSDNNALIARCHGATHLMYQDNNADLMLSSTNTANMSITYWPLDIVSP